MNAARIFRGIGVSGVMTAGGMASQLLLIPVLIHHWGLTGFGIWLLLTSVPVYLAITNLGLASVASNDMAAALARGETVMARRVLATTFRAVMFLASSLVALSVIIVPFLPLEWAAKDIGGLAADLPSAVLMLVVYSALLLLTDVQSAGFRARGQFATAAAITGGMIIAERLAVILAVNFDARILGAVAAMVMVRVAGIALMRRQFTRAHPDLVAQRGDANLDDLKRLLPLGVHAALLPAGQALSLHGPIIVVGAVLGPAATGLFGSLRTLTRLPVQLMNTVSTPIMPEMAMAVGRKDQAAKRLLFGLNIGIGLAIGAAALMAFWLAGPMLAALWLPAIVSVPIGGLLAVLSAMSIIHGLWLMGGNMLLAANHQSAYAAAFVISAAAVLGVILLWDAELDLVAIAWVMLAGEMVMLGIVAVQTRRFLIGRYSGIFSEVAHQIAAIWRKKFGRIVP